MMFFFTVDEKIPTKDNDNENDDVGERCGSDCSLTWFLWYIAEGAS
jgi:hypothetical protein